MSWTEGFASSIERMGPVPFVGTCIYGVNNDDTYIREISMSSGSGYDDFALRTV